MNRRAFLALTGALGLSMATVGIPLSYEALKFNSKLFKVSQTVAGMGTFITITLLHSSRDQAEEAMGLAFAEIERLSSMMNRYQNDSYISRLNSNGSLKDVPTHVMNVLHASLAYYKVTQGAFDITVKPVVDLYKESFTANNKPPSPHAIEEVTTSCVGSHHISLLDKEVSLSRPDMGVTLDGIAKGYIVDQAMALLRKHGIQHALINAGGDIAVHGNKGKNTPWRIAIQDPWKQGRPLEVCSLTRGALATSGNYEVYYDQEKLFHHLVTPHTGIPARKTASVSILASSAMEADTLATAVSVMGSVVGTGFLNRMPGIDGYIIDLDRQETRTEGWVS